MRDLAREEPGAQLRDGVAFPAQLVCAEPDATRGQLSAWIDERLDALLAKLARHGALLFRGFPISGAEDFDYFLSRFGFGDFGFDESLSNAVRRQRTQRVFTANEAPSSAVIALHHELAQTADFPRVLFLYCEQPATRGGATVVCRSDTLYESLRERRPGFVEQLAEHGLRYTTFMPPWDDPASGQGRSWRGTFGVEDRAQAERTLARLGYRWQWLADDELRATTPTLPAIRATAEGRPALFNQLIAAHAGWRADDREAPAPVELGNGDPLDSEAMNLLAELAARESVDLEWRRGDVALVDNHGVMHGRRPFEGRRSVLAAFGRDV